MISKLIFYLGVLCFVALKANGLKCYDCTPNHNQGIRMECLTEDGKYGTNKTCNAFHGACAKATYADGGQRYTIRECKANTQGKEGTCEEVQLDTPNGKKSAKECYCGTDLCNGSIQMIPGLYVVVLGLLGVVMMIKSEY